MTVDFTEHFWGESPKNNGIDVLFQNLKYGISSSKDFGDFLKERSSLEETESKSFLKLAKVAANGCAQGSFSPVWQLLKASSEKLSSAHVEMSQKVEDLLKELSKYTDELQKKHKSVKDEEASTVEAVQLYQNSKTMVSKTKAVYMQRFVEFEKCQKDNASQKELEKAEGKMKKAQEEYRSWVEKYQTCTEDYLQKFSSACQRFQCLEESYLKQMKMFLENYAALMENSQELIGRVHLEFREMCSQLNIDELLSKFVSSKGTGKEKPSALDVEDIPIADAISQRSGSSEDKSSLDKTPIPSENKKREGFLRGIKSKAKKGDKKAETNGKDDKIEGDLMDTNDANVEVDDEGYRVRPQVAGWETENKTNFYSDSDTDSDEEPEKRFHVEIKPLANGSTVLSASVDELRTTMENITLAPLGFNGRRAPTDAEVAMKRSQSVSQQIGNPSPPPVHPYAPLSPPVLPNNNSPASRYADLGDLFAEVGEIRPSIFDSSTRSRNTPTPSGTSIPRPASRPRQELLNQRSISTPSPVVSRAESVTFGGSRGPSPLTLGIGDTIPLAVAFHEIIHAYFKGSDENKCQVKMTGDMMVSFPAGIIQMIMNNPVPPLLQFTVRTTQALDCLEPKSDLVQMTRNDQDLQFHFDMGALVSLLRSHAEKTPSASYFNIDILKYHIKPKTGAASCPLHLVAFWKCESRQTDLRIDYKYNSHATEPPSASLTPKPEGNNPLVQVCIAAPVDGNVKSFQSKPTAQWFPNTSRVCWKMATLSSSSENMGVGSLRARFEVSDGPSSKGTVAAQFSCEGGTLSGSEFELIGSGYRVSLVKKRFVSGKYICDAELGPQAKSIGTPDNGPQ